VWLRILYFAPKWKWGTRRILSQVVATAAGASVNQAELELISRVQTFLFLSLTLKHGAKYFKPKGCKRKDFGPGYHRFGLAAPC
jgi:hypothetical protein